MKTVVYTNNATAICEACGAEIILKQRERRRQYHFKRFCSKRCSKMGELNPNWKGDLAGRTAGRKRAANRFTLSLCAKCGKPAMDRHHKDTNTLNNHPGNIEVLCRRCHMKEDGRLAQFIELARTVSAPRGRAVAAANRISRTHCKNGHPYTPSNTYRSSRGARVCRQCNSSYQHGYRCRSYPDMKDGLNAKRRKKYATERGKR